MSVHRRLRLIRLVGASVTSTLMLALAISTSRQATATNALTWLALGDSYSSGEGVPGTTRQRDATGKECARATGWLDHTQNKRSDAKSWAVVAYEQLQEQGFSEQEFVACTGAINDDWYAQVAEARKAGRTSWDVVSYSFGGNSIGFANVVTGCLDMNSFWGAFDLSPGCDVDLETMKRRIDILVGKQSLSNEFKGSVTLPDLYDETAALVKPGGVAVVAGYPQVVEEAGRWSTFQSALGSCQGLLRHDVPMLRQVGAYLNEQIRQAVESADKRWMERGVRFVYADLATQVYETGDESEERHGLCANKPWLNGVTLSVTSGDFRKERSFHPTQNGHTAAGAYVARLVKTSLARNNRYLYELFKGGESAGPTGTKRDYSDGLLSSPDSTSFWVGCEGAPAVSQFSIPEGSRWVTGTLLLDPERTPADLIVDVGFFGDEGEIGHWILRPGIPVPLKVDVSGAESLRLDAQAIGGQCTMSDIGYGVAVGTRVISG